MKVMGSVMPIEFDARIGPSYMGLLTETPGGNITTYYRRKDHPFPYGAPAFVGVVSMN